MILDHLEAGLGPNRANRASGLLGLGSGDRLLGSVRSRCISDCSVSVSVQPSRGILGSVSVRLVLLGALVTYGNDLPRLSATLSSVGQGSDHEVTEGSSLKLRPDNSDNCLITEKQRALLYL